MLLLFSTGSPSAFPTNSKAVQLQNYVNFAKDVIETGNKYRESREFSRKPYLSVHIRHGSDWVCNLNYFFYYKICNILILIFS